LFLGTAVHYHRDEDEKSAVVRGLGEQAEILEVPGMGVMGNMGGVTRPLVIPKAPKIPITPMFLFHRWRDPPIGRAG
jgi:hypothetical protein